MERLRGSINDPALPVELRKYYVMAFSHVDSVESFTILEEELFAKDNSSDILVSILKTYLL